MLSAFYPHIRVLPSHPLFTLISVFYPLVRPSIRPSVRIRVLPLPPYKHAASAYKHAATAYKHAATVYKHAASAYKHAATAY